MIKHLLVNWKETEAAQVRELIHSMTQELAEYARKENASAFIIKQRKELIQKLAKFVDNTNATMNQLAFHINAEMEDQFKRGMKYQAKLSQPQYDKYGIDKEFVRIQSIIRSQNLDNV